MIEWTRGCWENWRVRVTCDLYLSPVLTALITKAKLDQGVMMPDNDGDNGHDVMLLFYLPLCRALK